MKGRDKGKNLINLKFLVITFMKEASDSSNKIQSAKVWSLLVDFAKLEASISL